MNELEIIRHSRVPGMTVFTVSVDYRTPHFHPEWELIQIVENAMVVSCAGKQLEAKKGDLLLFQPGEVHEFHKIGGECTFLCLQVSPDLLHLQEDLAVDTVILNEVLGPELTETVRKELLAAADAYLSGEDYVSLHCVGRVCLLFYTLLRSLPVRFVSTEERLGQEKRNRRLASLLKFVDENYMHKIRLSDFAEAEGFSLSYLSHFVKSSLNQSFQEYVNSVRVNCACKLIAAGEEKLTSVCLSSGFSDYRYFSAAFKKQFGMTPEQYRLSVRKPENAVTHHSIHSLERFYSDEQSRGLLSRMGY